MSTYAVIILNICLSIYLKIVLFLLKYLIFYDIGLIKDEVSKIQQLYLVSSANDGDRFTLKFLKYVDVEVKK